MIHEVPLSALPADVHVPDDLQGRFRYDADRQRLCFDGFMSKANFDRLVRLSHNEQYQRALEELFRISVPEDTTSGAHATRAALIAKMACGIVSLAGLAVWFLLAR